MLVGLLVVNKTVSYRNMKGNLWLVTFMLIALLATLIPAVYTIQEAGGWSGWQDVPPKGTADSLYYYARIHEVSDGYPLNGNPYIYEYRDAHSPSFFLPDVISSVPMLLGLSFNATVLTNVFIWSVIFLVLSFILFRLLNMPERWAFFWSIFLYISSYSFMLRPGGMQISYPAFLLFLIMFLQFLYEPLIRRKAIWLSIVVASTFYVYTYLSYIVLLVFVFVFFWYLLARRYKEFRAIIVSGLCTALLLIPFGIYTFVQMGGLYYYETLRRIGLVFTHIPSIEAFYF